ncbi:uncharacterized protein HMPREF1541_05477 [Cyphellophora europaea CBS 101466]|uniref:Zn(2)-C6 fungal-type domain-containing protein n=1 Tax=Cyphellophora europaea (strain CBS 101466) TaxID=1220924 RepID=W2RU59_CYPE1|nr:uncharacterized protein HMPREF1541_05477 [Cyphellophora europaea CBS 101466]ETN39254.1 hypothetical protein HMPREF1541_05477 [Cyphellophora europaea CBS 101466]
MSLSTSLGPQCITCQKRRVKCDSSTPRCRRCARDQRNCPGYGKQRRWIAFEPTKGNVRPSASSTSSSSCSPGPLEPVYEYVDAAKHLQVALLDPTRSRQVFDIGVHRRDWHIAESVEYCNHILVPDLVPYPFQHQLFAAIDDWKKAPLMLQSTLLVVVYNCRLVRGNTNELVTDLYRYRGEALRELAQEVKAPSTRNPVLGLVGVLMMLQAEIQVSCIARWDVHLLAARRLLKGLGGLVETWHKIPQIRLPLALYVIVDIMSTPTSPASLLIQEELDDACNSILRLPSLEQIILASCCPVPIPILTIITQVSSWRKRVDTFASQASGDSWKGFEASFRSALQRLDSFDADEWATRIIIDFPDNGSHNERKLIPFRESEVSEWAALGQCFQSATTIYLLRSVASSGLRLHKGSAIVPDTNIEERLEDEVRTLDTTLDQLMLRFGEQHPTSLRPGLWRFTMFPLVIHAFELLVWRVPSSSVQHHCFSRMKTLGLAIGLRTMDGAIECIDQAMKRRDILGGDIRWDDLFNSRAIFVV